MRNVNNKLYVESIYIGRIKIAKESEAWKDLYIPLDTLDVELSSEPVQKSIAIAKVRNNYIYGIPLLKSKHSLI